jgi:alpha-tubulin suppressor-like RCC1 family protein
VAPPPFTPTTSLYLGGGEQGSAYQNIDGIIKTVGRGTEGQNGPNGPKLDVSTSLSTVPIGPPKSGNAVKSVRLAAATTAFVDSVSAGSYHTAAIRSGQVYTWGSNYYGNLCDGTTTDNATPTAATGMSSALAVAAGNAKTLALLSDGTVWACGGYAGTPALGNGTTNASTVAVQVSGLSNVTGIATAPYFGFHSLAILGDGSVWAWGPNSAGQIGDGTKVNRNVPVKVSSLTGVKAVAASMNGSLALANDGTVWSWGQIAGGANNASAPVTQATPGQVAGLTNVVAIAAGDTHYLALKSDGTVWAWGLDFMTGNRNGQLGNGTVVNSNTPTQVPALSGVTHIGAGGYHSLARKSDGSVWAWGWNAHGQLGDGATTDRHAPVQVPGLALN